MVFSAFNVTPHKKQPNSQKVLAIEKIRAYNVKVERFAMQKHSKKIECAIPSPLRGNRE